MIKNSYVSYLDILLLFSAQRHPTMTNQNVPIQPSKHHKPTKKAVGVDIFIFTPALIIQPPSATALASFKTVPSDGRCQHQTIEEIEVPASFPPEDCYKDFDLVLSDIEMDSTSPHS